MSHPRTAVVLLLALTVPAGATAASPQEIARGGYIVATSGCADCHAPLKMGPNGPATDLSRGLSGHPAGMTLPPPPAPQGPWIAGMAATNTAFHGPWGISYAINLTPDRATGIGAWKVDDFVAAMRTGKHLGVGRPIMPPMPWPAYAQMTDADLRAIFAYLMAQPAVVNAVPDAVVAARP